MIPLEVNRSSFPEEYRRLLESSELPAEELTDENVEIHEGKINGRTVGFGALQNEGRQALLRSVVVKPENRNHG